MARTQSKHYPEIRRGILERAAALFAKKGYPRSTIEDIAGACRMSRGALYHYFDSKEAILREILTALLQERVAAVSEAALAGNSPRERLRLLIRTMVQSNAASVSEQIVLLNDLQFLQRRDRARAVKLQNEVVQVIADAIAALDTGGRVTEANLKTYTMMLIGMINYTYLWYDPKGPVAPDAYAEMVCETFFEGVLA